MSMASTISYPVRTGVASPMLLVLTLLACSTMNLACNSELQGSPTESSSQPQQETDIFSDLDNTDSSYSPELPIWVRAHREKTISKWPSWIEFLTLPNCQNSHLKCFSQFENLVRFLNSYWLKQSLVNIAIVELPEGVSRFISHNTELLIVDGTPVSGVLVVVGGAAIYSGVSQGICAVCAGTLFSEAIDNEILFRLAFSSGITSYFGRFFSRISRLRSWNLPSNSVDSSELSKAFVHPFDSALTASWRYNNWKCAFQQIHNFHNSIIQSWWHSLWA